MSIYRILTEAEKADTVKRPFKEPISKLEDAIKIYNDSEDDEDKSDLLGTILVYLEDINGIMNAAGITYTPDVPTDEDEDTFQNILVNYIETANKFLESDKVTDFESFNSQTRYITSLVDIHRTQYVKEGEILMDPET